MKELIAILPAEYRRRGLWVALTLLLRALLNLAGLAALLPVLSLVLDPAAFTEGGRLAGIYARSGLASPHRFALIVCAAVALFVVLKCGANFLLARVERRYIYDLYHTLSRRLYVAYHDRGMAFVADSNSSLLTRNVNVVCLSFVAGVLRPMASIVAEALLLILIFTALLFYAPLAALLAAAVFLPAVWLYRVLVRNRIDRYGARENRAQREKTRLVAETFRGYADIELSNAFPSMLRAFDRVVDEVVRTRSHEADIGLLPQILTEIGLAAGMTLLAAWSFGDSQSGVLFGVFAVAAFRLMPSIRNILSGWSKIRFNRYTLAVLRDAPTQCPPERHTPPPTEEKLPFEHEIAVRKLRFRYPKSRKELFGGLSLTIRKGERLGIRGVSGVGKTTLFKLLLGFYEPTEGRITVDGVPLGPDNRRAWQNRIGYVSQRLFLSDGSFAANVAPGVPLQEIDRTRVLEALEAACLGDFISTLPRGIDTPIGECGCRLSGGQRQRIGIARALYRRADVLFFDEATSALDSRTEQEVNRAIATIAARNPGLTLLVIAHRESSLAYCDRTITLGK